MKFTKTIKKANKEQLVVNIEIKDYFSITGELYIGRGRSDKSLICCGCIHDEIKAVANQYNSFIKLHLSDLNGTSMHIIANESRRLWLLT